MPHPCRHSRPGWMWLWAAWAAGWNEMSIVVLFNQGHSVILRFYGRRFGTVFMFFLMLWGVFFSVIGSLVLLHKIIYNNVIIWGKIKSL